MAWPRGLEAAYSGLLENKGIHHLMGPKAGIHCDVVVWESKSSAIGNALGTNGVYLSPFGRFDVDLDKRIDFERMAA